MKILLLITICESYKDRALNQIKALTFFKQELEKCNIVPVFSVGKEGIDLDNSFLTIRVDVEEQYTNLHKKIIESLKYIHTNIDYDYVIKIDDDTLFNIDMFDCSILTADYIGRLVPKFVENYIQMPMLGIFQKLKLYPQSYTESFSFMPGDFYILSRHAINCIINNLGELEKFNEKDFLAEDQLLGYLLRNSPITMKDIGLNNKYTERNFLQITKNYMSIHPIMSQQFGLLLNASKQEQISMMESSSGRANFLYRKMMANQLQEKLIEVMKEFLNSKKSSGMC